MKISIASFILAASGTLAFATTPTETITIDRTTGAVLNVPAADFAPGKLKVGGVTITAVPSWSSITGRPSTLGGYGITDPIVLSITGAVGEITVTNGSGGIGNAALSLTATGLTAGTYERVTFDAKGRATAATELPWLVAVGSGGGIITIPVGVGTLLNYWSKTAGTGAITGGSRWTPGRAGWYIVQVFVGGEVLSDQVQLGVLKNGSKIYYAQSSMWYRGVGGFVAVDVADGDFLEIYAAIWSAGDWGTVGNDENARWVVRWLGPK